MLSAHSLTALTAALLMTASIGVATASSAAAAGAKPPVYPTVGPTTRYIDHARLLGDTPEPAWYEANIPFVDLPDQAIQDTYYYRWRTFKEALKYTGPKDGWIVSEFLGPVGYSAPNGGINAAAGHHLYEGRWLRDTRYLDDYLDYWLRGPGSAAKPATEGLGKDTTDWAHQYSFWAVDAAVARAQVTGDFRFLTNRMPELERQYRKWNDKHFNRDLGLYWQTPVWDAMEFTASSYQSDDPYHGGDGFRPTLNAYQYGDARALAVLARHTGDTAKAEKYEREAAALRANQEKWLWDPATSFYKHVMRDDNPSRTRITDREQIGFIPWYFHMAPAENAAAWAQLTDPQGFAAPYGPTTTERRSRWFMHEALNGCCRWDGPSWPYASSQTLTALANLLIDYPAQSYVDRRDFYDVLRGYALTQRKDGQPYVAEAHHPDEDRWIYDGRGHSEDYNHSTYNDIVLSGLLGIRPQRGDTVQIAPLVPDTWDHFAVENLAYHGHNLTVLFDRDGSHYGQGTGLRIWVDGVLKHQQSTLVKTTVAVGGPVRAELPDLVDDAANVAETGYPKATASYTWSGDKAVDAIDGQDFHLDVPSTRWTTYRSPNRSDWLQVDLGAATPISDVRIIFYDDGGGVRTPDTYQLQYQHSDGTWQDLPGQRHEPVTPVGRAVNRILIDPPVTTDRLRVVTSRADGGAVGITALQAWRPADPVLSVGFTGLRDGAIAADSGATVTVRTRVTAAKNARDVKVSLEVPRGWTARAVTPAATSRMDKGDLFATSWRVTVPAEANVGNDLPIRALATSHHGGVSAALAPTQYFFDPADFPTVAWNDDFSTDRLPAYRIDQVVGTEPAPTLSVTDGTLVASANTRSFGILAAPVTGSARGTAVIVTPKAFSGAQPEDSLFLGQSAGPADNALAWYNNHFATSGADVRRGGATRPDATGGCCTAIRWQTGDRFAAVLRDGHLTTWAEHDDVWRQIHDAPIGLAVDPATLSTWAPAIGLRLDSGSITVDSIDARTR